VATGGIREGERPFEAVHRLVRLVPRGCVVSYGDVSDALGQRLSPLAVGWALQSCPPDVPWQRVIGADGYLRTGRRGSGVQAEQRRRLEEEGVAFTDEFTVDIAAHRWTDWPEPGETPAE
jgi:methylated-DNA-protein-cysteine methyltransferase related protein